MLHAGLHLSRKRLDICLLSDEGELVEQTATPPDLDGLRAIAERFSRHDQPIRGAIESMTGARFVHDTLEDQGWEVLIADAGKVKPFGRVACKTDKVDSQVLALQAGDADSLRLALADGAGDRQGAGVHDRLGDRRHLALSLGLADVPRDVPNGMR